MERRDGTLSYLASDGLGSVTAALSSSSAVLAASQLFGPYGAARYQSGVMPTAKGFTGQYADAATGLDYYSARYYDPLAGQFISADSVLPGDGMDVWGLSRYAYVEGNPETQIDPTGHWVCGGGAGRGGADAVSNPAGALCCDLASRIPKPPARRGTRQGRDRHHNPCGGSL